MKKGAFVLIALIMSLGVLSSGYAEITGINEGPVQWTGPGANNHWYEAFCIPEGINWNEAKAAAEARGGYLATVNSIEENNFIFSLINDWRFWSNTVGMYSDGPFLGGYYVGTSGSMNPNDWTWVTGEPWGYKNWGTGQPDETFETVLHFWGPGIDNMQPTWNNLRSDSTTPKGYVVEWNRRPPPNPAIYLLFGLEVVMNLAAINTQEWAQA